jgi:hypothetical protein
MPIVARRLINASLSKIQPVLVHRLLLRGYDHLFVTNTANSIPLSSGLRNTIGKRAAYDVTH